MTSYTWINKQGVQSSDGLVVRYTGRFDLEVRWGKRKKLLFAEGVLRPEDLDERQFDRWDTSAVRNDDVERKRIFEAVREALSFMDRSEPT